MTEYDLKKYQHFIRAKRRAEAVLLEYEAAFYSPRTQKISPLPQDHRENNDLVDKKLERLEDLRKNVDRLGALVLEAESVLLYVAAILQSDNERDIIVYRYYKDMKIEDIIDIMGCSRSTYFNYRSKILERIETLPYGVPST